MNRNSKRIYDVSRKIKWFIYMLIFLTMFATAGLMVVSAQYLNLDECYMKTLGSVTFNAEMSGIFSIKECIKEQKVREENVTEEWTEKTEDSSQSQSYVEPAADLISDTVYIGDSRMEGFILNSGIKDAMAFTDIGMTVDSVFTKSAIYVNGNTVTVIEALRMTNFNRVYIMLGINETGWAYESVFVEKYKELIDEIQNLNPNADIYIQSILPVSQNVSDTHQYINNNKIEYYNVLLQNLALEESIHYLNVAEVMMDENGALPDEASFDGIHLKKEYCLKWLEYIENNL